MGRIEDLAERYYQHISTPWQRTVRVRRGDRHDVSARGETGRDLVHLGLDAAGEWGKARCHLEDPKPPRC